MQLDNTYKILPISNREYLAALYQLLGKSSISEDVIRLSESQLLMLNMSNEDIRNNRVVSQEEADKRDLKWLKSCSLNRNSIKPPLIKSHW